MAKPARGPDGRFTARILPKRNAAGRFVKKAAPAKKKTGRREEKQYADSRARWERERKLAERRHRAAYRPPSKKKAAPSKKKAAPSKKKVAPSKKKVAPSKKAAPSKKKVAPSKKKVAPSKKKAAPARRRTKDGKFAPSPSTVRKRRKEANAAAEKAAADAAFRERIRAKAREATARRALSAEATWQAWEAKAKERQPDILVNFDSALRREIRADDPAQMLGFLTLTPYVPAPLRAEWSQWLTDGRAARIFEHWTRTGVMPPEAVNAPVQYWIEDRHFKSANRMLNGLFSNEFVTTEAVRVDGRLTEQSSGSKAFVARGSNFVRLKKERARAATAARMKRLTKGD